MNEREIFANALQKETDTERSAYLDEACSGDADMRQRIEALLQEKDDLGSFLESPAQGGGTLPPIEPPITEKPGTQIGPYKLLEQIGEGGMGVVYMAEQIEPVERRVALKIIKPGMDTRQVIARFEAEEQALAMMDHPNIAKVLDAGATESGRPYFVMELVKGISIVEYCDRKHLTPKERLELFIPVCQAVQHAHQKGIIHRDLKPSNVLIALYDDRPVPKVIDFGVAKATSQRLTEKTMFTHFGQIVGTLEYMSPEQANLNQLDIDTRSDVYSMGVLLYELLTGATPFDRERLRSAAFEEMMRIIREEEPPKPSTRLSTIDALPSVAANRKTEPKKLSALVRGELDWIVMKALEKDRTRRYETANGFANDIQRYLDDEAVLACPPSAGYRLRKFARRNKAVIGTASVVAAALILGIVGTSWQAIRATRERNRAITAEELATDRLGRAVEAEENERELAKEAQRLQRQAQKNLERARDNLGRALDAADQLVTCLENDRFFVAPEMRELRQAVLKEALELFQAFIDQHGTDPVVRYQTARAYWRIFVIQKELGRFDQAERTAERAISLAERLVAESPSERKYREILAMSDAHLGTMLVFPAGRPQDGERPLRRAIGQYEKLIAESPDVVDNPSDLALYRMQLVYQYNSLVWVLKAKGEYQEAERISRQLAAEAQKLVTEFPEQPGHRNTLAYIWRERGALLAEIDRLDEASEAFRRALEIQESLVGEFPKDWSFRRGLSLVHLALGNLRNKQGRLHEAEQSYRKAIAIAEELASERPLSSEARRELTFSYRGLVWILENTQRLEEAAQAFRHVVEAYRNNASLAPHDPLHRQRLGDSYSHLGSLLERTGQHEKAEEAYRHEQGVYEKLAEDLPKEPSYGQRVVQIQFKLADALKAAGRDQEAAELSRCALANVDEAIKLNPGNADLLIRRARAYVELKQWDKAIEDFEQVVKLTPHVPVESSIHTQMLLLANRTEEYQEACVTMLQQFGRSEDPAAVFEAARACLLSPNGAGDPAVPLALAKRAVAMRPEWPWTHYVLGMAHLRMGQYEEATEHFHDSLKLAPDWHPHLNWLGLAMVYHESGETDKARQWYDMAADRMTTNSAECELVFQDWLEGQVRQREADQLLGIDQAGQEAPQPAVKEPKPAEPEGDTADPEKPDDTTN